MGKYFGYWMKISKSYYITYPMQKYPNLNLLNK